MTGGVVGIKALDCQILGCLTRNRRFAILFAFEHHPKNINSPALWRGVLPNVTTLSEVCAFCVVASAIFRRISAPTKPKGNKFVRQNVNRKLWLSDGGGFDFGRAGARPENDNPPALWRLCFQI